MAASSPDPSEVPFRHRVEYAAFRVVRALLMVLPDRAADALGSILGQVAGSLLRIRRGVVDENLERAFPEATPRWRNRVARASYRHLVREAITTFRLGRLDPERIRSMTTFRGDAAGLLDAARDGGALLVTGHLGNWEFAGACLAVRGVPVDAVALVQANRLFDRDVVEARERLGLKIMPRGAASKQVVRSLREGRSPALVADQNARRGGVFVDFFGVPASTAKGPAIFALRTGAPMFCGAAIRRPDRGYDVFVVRVPVESTGDVEADVRRVTQAHTRVLEDLVRRYPEQYFWQHKRWKTRPK